MNIDKDQVLQLLRSQGKHDEAQQAEQQLPQQVDTDSSDHQDLLSKLGVNLDDVQGKLGGLGNLL